MVFFVNKLTRSLSKGVIKMISTCRCIVLSPVVSPNLTNCFVFSSSMENIIGIGPSKSLAFIVPIVVSETKQETS